MNNRVVALKVIDVDSTDYKSNARAKDDTIEVTIHEIKVLKQLKDSKAKNVNMFFDAFQIHSQLWIVNDYCPGGSVHTLVSDTVMNYLSCSFDLYLMFPTSLSFLSARGPCCWILFPVSLLFKCESLFNVATESTAEAEGLFKAPLAVQLVLGLSSVSTRTVHRIIPTSLGWVIFLDAPSFDVYWGIEENCTSSPTKVFSLFV